MSYLTPISRSDETPMLNLVIGECSSLVGDELDILDKKEDLEEDATGTVLNRYCVICNKDMTDLNDKSGQNSNCIDMI